MSAPSLTALLNQSLAGDAGAAERAWAEVYVEIRTIAAAAIAREKPLGINEADMHPTVLVNEIFLRIGRSPPLAWDTRRHFFGAVHQACDQVLVDHARSRKALKRGNGRAPVPLTFVASELSKHDTKKHAAEFGLPTALEQLARDYPRAAEIARMRYMVGLSGSTIATVIAVSESTVEKDLSFARAWLKRALDRDL